jgi:hypothetical protein
MKLVAVIIMGILLTTSVTAQVIDLDDQLAAGDEDIEEGWHIRGLFSLSFSQNTLTNWAAGGENSIAGNGLVNMFADYRRGSLIWNNSFDLGYGLQRREGETARKTDDKIDLFSKIGKQAAENWYYSGLLNFKTQMAPGYDYSNDESDQISNFLSPAYILAALGMDYRPIPNFSLFMAPLTGKFTIVRDDALGPNFGLDEGENLRSEFGGYLRTLYRADLTETITFQTKLDLFSNYLDSPQNIDINWENLLMMRVTQYISVSFMTHLIYDDDILIGLDTNDDGNVDHYGPRVQFKQLLGVGFAYNF